MSVFLLIALVLFIVILVGLFYAAPAPYGNAGKFVAAICALLLFLIAIGALHI